MKKKILFIFVLLISVLLSCSDSDTCDIIYKLNNSIYVRGSIKTSTKSRVLENIDFNAFTMFCYETDGEYCGNTNLGVPFMNEISLFKSDKKTVWDYEGEYYWPRGKMVQAFAISPFDESILDYQVKEYSYPSFEYVVDDACYQEDVVVSTLQNKHKREENKEEILEFCFVPIFSQINISFKGEDDGFDYYITELQLQNLKNKGKFTFSFESKVGYWSELEGNTNYSFEIPYSFVVQGKTLSPLTGYGKTLMLLPQEFTEKTRFKIKYTVKNKKTDLEVFNGFKYVDLSNINLQRGSNIRFYFSLPVDNGKVSYSIKNSEWDSPNEGDVYYFFLNRNKTSILKGESEQLEAFLNFKEYENSKSDNKKDVLIWSSSDSSVARVSNDGLVTAIGNGTAEITVKLQNSSTIVDKTEDVCIVTVTDKIVIPDEFFMKALLDLGIDINGDKEISLEEAFAVKTLNIKSKNIYSLEGISYFKNLETLICSNNNLSILDLSNLYRLKKLNCSSNRLKNIELRNCFSIETIKCEDNSLIFLDVSECYNIINLNCSSNSLENIALGGCDKLKNLNCSSNMLKFISLSDCERLYVLDCSSNRLKNIDITNNFRLYEFNCLYNEDLECIYVWRTFDKENYWGFNKPFSATYVK